MKLLYRIFSYSLTTTPMDLWLVRLSSWSVGVGVLVLVALTLPRHAANQAELLLGLGLAVLNCLISMLFGTLSPRVHFAEQAGTIPWRSRIWEWSSYAAGVAILTFGMWFTGTLSLTRAGFISAFLLLLAITLATFCVGILCTLLRHDPLFDRQKKESQ